MHDYCYYLGFTEDNYNLQLTTAATAASRGDPEVGNAQAGALTGGNPTYLGRDNANQIALQDGIPGITNQYLFQPIAGSFYSPCTDGALDMSIVGHEYTHAISNRMIGGPDDGITSEQGGAMGESWGDLNAAEHMFGNGYSNGASPWVVGPYATGNATAGIRDYAIDKNPLNYSDYGFDTTGPEVHADGEIWNGTQWEVRQALVAKWNSRFPYADKQLQKDCAIASGDQSPLPATHCPGNRRWIQLIFDAFLLQQGATSMLDARDAMIAADQMRFGGADVDTLWAAFARRGMGATASTPDADSSDPTPSFASPKGPNATVTFPVGRQGVGLRRRLRGPGDPRRRPRPRDRPGREREVHAGQLPDALRLAGPRLPAVHAHGRRRRCRPDRADRRHRRQPRECRCRRHRDRVDRRLAQPGVADRRHRGHQLGRRHGRDVDVSKPSVAVALAGGVHTVRRVKVSAYLTPAPADPNELPLAADPDSGSRFTALRKFALQACVSGCAADGATWKTFYTSADDAFPGTVPRPVAPDQTLRTFAVPATQAAAVRLVALENQCTGNDEYAGEQDSDPSNATDCATASDRGTIVHASELQVFNALAAPGGVVQPTKPKPTKVRLTVRKRSIRPRPGRHGVRRRGARRQEGRPGRQARRLPRRQAKGRGRAQPWPHDHQAQGAHRRDAPDPGQVRAARRRRPPRLLIAGRQDQGGPPPLSETIAAPAHPTGRGRVVDQRTCRSPPHSR